MTSLAGSMRRRGASEQAILAALLEENRTRCKPLLDEHEVTGIVRSMARYEPASNDGRAIEELTLTDVGNARRFVIRHRDSLRYCPPWKTWLIWDGKRWRPDQDGGAQELAKETVRSIYAEASLLLDYDERRALVRHARESESAPRIRAMMLLASSDPDVVILPDQLDAGSTRYLFDVLNGTLDLIKKEFREHRREDFITKLAPVTFDPEARCPLWDRFLERVQPDPAVRELDQRFLGSALTGDTSDEQFIVAFGPGRNGKTTLIETELALLGDYGHKIDSETLLAATGRTDQRGAPRPDLMALRGARLVAAVEAGEGRRLDENLVKQLTGRDTISARHLYQDETSFTPEHKIIIAANHLPEIRGTDPAIWERVILVPFEVVIPREERDTTLKDRLREPRELSGILNWALAGCYAWQSVTVGSRLRPPASVLAATRAYREEEDVLAPFLADRCVLNPTAWVSTKNLGEAYREWCEATGVDQLKWRTLTRRLRDAGCTPKPNPDSGDRNRTRGWHGLRLKMNGEGDDDSGTVGTDADDTPGKLPF